MLTPIHRLATTLVLSVAFASTSNFDSACLLAQQPAVLESVELDSVALPDTDEGLAGEGPIRRYDWFKNLWKKRRTEFASRTPVEQGAVVFLGDSITQGWTDDFRGDFGDLTVANRGISGDTTRGMLIRLDEDVFSLQPSGVVMLMGTNDLEEQAEPATIANNIQLILDEIKDHNDEIPIVLCQVFPSSAQKKRPADKIKEINRLVAAAVKGNPQVTLVDTWALFANSDGDAKIEEFPDLLHPNRAGYEKWLAAIWPVLATHGFVDTKADEFKMEPGFTSLFNGHDLTGWCYRPTSEKMLAGRKRWLGRDPENAPSWPIVTKTISMDGKTSSEDGRYVAKNGRLIVTTPADGRSIQQIWTSKEFPGDFTLKLEFRATPNADSGVFLREPQLQCRDFPLAGPYKDLKNFRSGDWNELIVDVKENVARCTCNGELIEDGLKLPETGPIGLEGDRGQVEYRRIRISTN